MSKLVRNKITTLIAESGKTCHWRYADEKEHLPLLAMKLKEETNELIRATTRDEILEELADVFEVAETIAREFHISFTDIIVSKHDKREKKGGFNNFIVLEKIDD